MKPPSWGLRGAFLGLFLGGCGFRVPETLIRTADGACIAAIATERLTDRAVETQKTLDTAALVSAIVVCGGAAYLHFAAEVEEKETPASAPTSQPGR